MSARGLYLCSASIGHPIPKRPRIWGIQPICVVPVPSAWAENACVMAKWHIVFLKTTKSCTSIWRVNGFFTSSNRYSGRLRSYIGRICTPFAYLAGLYVLLAPSKSAIFVDLGPKMAKYGRWRPDTGVTRQPIAVPCSLVTMAAMYGHWLTHLRRICDIPSRRLLSAVLYGETPLGADRAEEVRLTAKRKP